MEIVSYNAKYKQAFHDLNILWLEGYDLLEEKDLACLEQPEAVILASGGEIFFALDEGTIAGTCAALFDSPGIVELAKLAVLPAFRQRGIGRRLCHAVLDYARRQGATRVILSSSSKLSPAIRLYESLGFRHVFTPVGIPYRSANVFMVLDLARDPAGAMNR